MWVLEPVEIGSGLKLGFELGLRLRNRVIGDQTYLFGSCTDGMTPTWKASSVSS